MHAHPFKTEQLSDTKVKPIASVLSAYIVQVYTLHVGRGLGLGARGGGGWNETPDLRRVSQPTSYDILKREIFEEDKFNGVSEFPPFTKIKHTKFCLRSTLAINKALSSTKKSSGNVSDH